LGKTVPLVFKGGKTGLLGEVLKEKKGGIAGEASRTYRTLELKGWPLSSDAKTGHSSSVKRGKTREDAWGARRARAHGVEADRQDRGGEWVLIIETMGGVRKLKTRGGRGQEASPLNSVGRGREKNCGEREPGDQPPHQERKSTPLEEGGDLIWGRRGEEKPAYPVKEREAAWGG